MPLSHSEIRQPSLSTSPHIPCTILCCLANLIINVSKMRQQFGELGRGELGSSAPGGKRERGKQRGRERGVQRVNNNRNYYYATRCVCVALLWRVVEGAWHVSSAGRKPGRIAAWRALVANAGWEMRIMKRARVVASTVCATCSRSRVAEAEAAVSATRWRTDAVTHW